MRNESIEQHTNYDRFGRTASESQPFFIQDSERHDTSYTYDVLDRVLITRLPYKTNSGAIAQTRNAYLVNSNGNRYTWTRDAAGRVNKSYTNALGQLYEVRDAQDNRLRYFYDSQSNLTRTIDAKGNNTVVGYDILGRRTSLNDPDLGQSNYAYDAFGDLTWQRDAKNQVRRMEYDKLGRLVKRTVAGSAADSGGESTWTYDTAPKGLGQLALSQGPNGYQKTFKYDNHSRLSEDITKIQGVSYNQRYYYNAVSYTHLTLPTKRIV